uniref:IPT/TIG domain-containing protein n=1 Tax=Candidatus Oscillochloris fontis TaxID=2496868 RepID=UPI001583ADF8
AGGRVIRSEELRVNGPQITALNPDHGLPNTQVVITGRNFGPDQRRSSVTFAGDVAKVETWSDTEILVIAPDALGSGHVIVTVQGIASNSIYFTQDRESIPDVEITPNSKPRKCFAMEPYEPPGPWIIPAGDDGPFIGWACVSGDKLYGGDISFRTGCPPPDDTTGFLYISGDFDGVSAITDPYGSLSGTYTPNGITLTIHYDGIPGVCPDGTATVVFDH